MIDKMATSMITRGATELCNLLRQDLSDYQQGRNPAILERLGRHIELFYRHVLASSDTNDDILTSLGDAVAHIRTVQANEETLQLVQDMTDSVVATRGRGRPRVEITQDQLEHLLELNFQISHVFFACL